MCSGATLNYNYDERKVEKRPKRSDRNEQVARMSQGAVESCKVKKLCNIVSVCNFVFCSATLFLLQYCKTFFTVPQSIKQVHPVGTWETGQTETQCFVAHPRGDPAPQNRAYSKRCLFGTMQYRKLRDLAGAFTISRLCNIANMTDLTAKTALEHGPAARRRAPHTGLPPACPFTNPSFAITVGHTLMGLA